MQVELSPVANNVLHMAMELCRASATMDLMSAVQQVINAREAAAKAYPAADVAVSSTRAINEPDDAPPASTAAHVSLDLRNGAAEGWPLRGFELRHECGLRLLVEFPPLPAKDLPESAPLSPALADAVRALAAALESSNPILRRLKSGARQ